jgi:hypothetical protein
MGANISNLKAIACFSKKDTKTCENFSGKIKIKWKKLQKKYAWIHKQG